MIGVFVDTVEFRTEIEICGEVRLMMLEGTPIYFWILQRLWGRQSEFWGACRGEGMQGGKCTTEISGTPLTTTQYLHTGYSILHSAHVELYSNYIHCFHLLSGMALTVARTPYHKKIDLQLILKPLLVQLQTTTP